VDLHAAAQCSGSSFVDVGPALEPAMPALEIEDGGAGDYYADLPLPRLRGAAEPRLDGDGMAVTVQVAGMAVGCATFRLPPR